MSWLVGVVSYPLFLKGWYHVASLGPCTYFGLVGCCVYLAVTTIECKFCFSYDTVDRDILWEKMRKLGFGRNFIQCLQACN